jgi:hypothetical protein
MMMSAISISSPTVLGGRPRASAAGAGAGARRAAAPLKAARAIAGSSLSLASSGGILRRTSQPRRGALIVRNDGNDDIDAAAEISMAGRVAATPRGCQIGYTDHHTGYRLSLIELCFGFDAEIITWRKVPALLRAL